MNIDLHCHTTNSDGTWSVEQVLIEAERKQVSALCISDHDNFKGSQEAFRKKDGLFSGELIAGIEISTSVDGHKVHFLAYFPTVDIPRSSELLTNLNKIQNSRVWRMNEMVKKANKFNMDVAFDEVIKEAGTGIEGQDQPSDIISRPHLARVLIKKGYVRDFDEAFDKYLADGKPLHVERFTLEFNQWITQVKALKGIMIWAHPLHGHDEEKSSVRRIGKILANSKIDGVERIYNYDGKYNISPEFERWGETYLDELIEQNDWLITSGGDFHGNVGVLGGLDLPDHYWLKFKSALYKE